MLIKIRGEEPGDIPGIQAVLLAAFDGPGEAGLVDSLRANGKAVISLAAVQGKEVVGHILFSPLSFSPPRPHIRALGLAPLAVLPGFQNKGIGSQLTRAGLARCRQIETQAVVVLGHPNYYPRFGFWPAVEYGLGNEYGAEEAFMALELAPGALNGVNATARYAPEFGQLG